MFEECERLLNEINCKTQQLKTLRELSVSTSINFEERVQTSSRCDKIARLTAEIIDLENEINTLVETYLELYDRIKNVLDKIEEPKVREMITRKYLVGESWQKISNDLGVTRQTLWRWNKEILQNFN